MMTGDRRYQMVLGLTLFMLLFGLYMITYRGLPMSGDEIFIFDSTESLARRGNLYRTFEFNAVALPQYDLVLGPGGEPWPPPLQEPMASTLQVPLFWLGQALPDVGIMHTVWLFNIIMTALTATSLYAIGLWQGYKPGVAWIGGLLFGVGTNAWPYGRLLFREPLMAFFVLWTFALAIYIQRHWEQKQVPWRAGILLIGCVIGAFLTKAITLLLLPGLLVVMLPDLGKMRGYRRLILRLGLVAIVLAGLIIFIISSGWVNQRYSLSNWLGFLEQAEWEYILESLVGFQISPGRSMWLYSPVLLLGVWGIWQLWRDGQWRIVVGPALGIGLFSLWYGIALTVDWSGGWGWGPRYLVPLIPVLILWVLPALAAVHKNHKGIGLVMSVTLLGIGIQLLGMAVPLSNYYTDLFFTDRLYDYDEFHANRQKVEDEWHWLEGNWSLEWSPVYYHLDRLDLDHLDVAWQHSDLPGVTVGLAAALAATNGAMGLWLLRKKQITSSLGSGYGMLAGGLIVFVMGSGLYSLRDDSRVTDEWTDVRDLVTKLDETVEGESVVFIDRDQYTPIFMNYFKTPALVSTLPYAPGETYGTEAAAIGGDEPLEMQVGTETVYALDWSADHYDWLWLVASSSPFETDKRRPIERYLAEYYFPVDEITVSPRARAIRFVTADVALGEPSILFEAEFGEQVGLVGIDLPRGTVFLASEGLAVSLVWQPIGVVEKNYNVGVYLLDTMGRLWAQRNGQPQGTFGQMTAWQTGNVYRDNHGLALPAELPPGEYRLAVAVYSWEDRQRLPVVTPAGSSDLLDLATITIR